MQLKRAAFVTAAACAALVVYGGAALALPQYAAQAGRTCDNCHIIPDWQQPKLADRKRNMSCGTCHVDPAGGGMRTTAGRYYGRSTLPMIAFSPRPQDDWDRNVPGLGRRDRATPYNSYLPVGAKDFEHAEAYRDSIHDRWAWGMPKGLVRTGPFPGRYFGMNPDPVFRIGGDFRFALLTEPGKNMFFPMQFDIQSALHPVHHATLLMNIGARGRPSGYSDTIDDAHTPYFRELFAMTNEWPYQTYAKAGRFVPSFGLKLDDHTTPTRRQFELDGSLPEARVLGVEAGAVAAYPFIQVSYFKMKSKYVVPDQWNIFDVDNGWGTALNTGWRALGWSAGGSVMLRRRPLDEGGDTDTYALYGSLNPWYFWTHIPVTLQGEIDTGRAQRASGLEAHQLAMYGEVDYRIWNGVNLLTAYDWVDPDRDVIDDETGRFQVGGQVIVIPGVTLDSRFRFLTVTTPAGNGNDWFTQLHIWF